jgi:hypothetical protein
LYETHWYRLAALSELHPSLQEEKFEIEYINYTRCTEPHIRLLKVRKIGRKYIG